MENSITIIADASFCSKTKAAGYGVWLASNNGKQAFEGPLHSPSDNNVAEAMAIANSLWHGLQSGLIKPKSNILIQSDSDSAIKTLSFKNNPYCQQMRDVAQYVESLVTRYKLRIRYKHVPGHTIGADKRTKAQNHCDSAAKRQMLLQRSTMGFEEIKPEKVRRNSTNYLRSRKRKSNDY